ncbi:FYVE-domain-containing protein [Xylariomycetidae sp. FL2044]|nr:FYVE-domain-containing protein [Xylariomycetidae sp. FL2044]
MATDFIMPRLPDQQQSHYFSPQQQPLPPSESPTYTPQGCQSQQISPLSTSNNTSPTSPKSFQYKAIRPLYMPAVLRPNEYYSRKARDNHTEGQEADGHIPSNGSFISLGSGLAALGRLSRRSTGDSGKCMDDEMDLDRFTKPTAQPTRRHWKPDTESSICDEPSCMRHFNTWTRRHHCRKCGNIFCDSHSAFDIPLDDQADFNPKGTLSRACNHCYNEFKLWRSTNSRASSEGSTPGSRTAPASPIVSTPNSGKGPHGHHQEVAMSVPRDWNWSTF